MSERPLHQESTSLFRQTERECRHKFDRAEEIKDQDKPLTGAPDSTMTTKEKNWWLFVGHGAKNTKRKHHYSCAQGCSESRVSNRLLDDDYIYEVTWDGKIVWEWLASDHLTSWISANPPNALYRNPNWNSARGSRIGRTSTPCRPWPDDSNDQDMRFHPDNIIVDGRQINVI